MPASRAKGSVVLGVENLSQEFWLDPANIYPCTGHAVAASSEILGTSVLQYPLVCLSFSLFVFVCCLFRLLQSSPLVFLIRDGAV